MLSQIHFSILIHAPFKQFFIGTDLPLASQSPNWEPEIYLRLVDLFQFNIWMPNNVRHSRRRRAVNCAPCRASIPTITAPSGHTGQCTTPYHPCTLSIFVPSQLKRSFTLTHAFAFLHSRPLPFVRIATDHFNKTVAS